RTRFAYVITPLHNYSLICSFARMGVRTYEYALRTRFAISYLYSLQESTFEHISIGGERSSLPEALTSASTSIIACSYPIMIISSYNRNKKSPEARAPRLEFTSGNNTN